MNSSHNYPNFQAPLQEHNKYFSFEEEAIKEKKTNEEKLNEKAIITQENYLIKNDEDSDKKLLK